jgi:hypothetical protein
MAARQSAISTRYDGQPAPTAGARGLLCAKPAPVRERRRRRIRWLPVRVQSVPLTAA